MERYAYLLVLLGLLGLLILVDARHKLAFFLDVKRTLYTLIPGLLLFIGWDATGISLNIFYPGHARFASGVRLAPGFPLEELFFLIDFVYLTLLLLRLTEELYVRLHRS